MKSTVLTVAFSLVSLGCAFYALAFPAWFMQRYKRDGHNLFQGYGIYTFRSTETLESPFYASDTTLQYHDFCKKFEATSSVPNYMLGDGEQFHKVLCGKAMHSMKITTSIGAICAVITLISSIVAVFNPSAGKAERVTSIATLASSVFFAASLVVWGWAVQQRLYQVDSINAAFSQCKADNSEWSCWFYGYSFWVCLAAVIIMSITGYLSSAGRAEKIRYFRKEYERDLAVAVQQSLEHDAAAQSRHVSGATATTDYQYQGNERETPVVYASAPPDPNTYENGSYGNQQNGYGNQGGYNAQAAYNNGSANQGYPAGHGNGYGETAFPGYKEERKNHTLLGRQPSGGVV